MSKRPADTDPIPTDAPTEPADQPAKPQAERRWYQFSLWSMFVWVTVIGVLLAVGVLWVAPAQQQRAAVQMVERLGGVVRYVSPPTNEGRLTTWLRDWLARDYFDAVALVIVAPVSDSDLRSLGSLTQLQWLTLGGSQVTDAGLPHLSRLKQMQSLSLEENQITGAGLAHLRGLTQLEELSLSNTQITDAGLTNLSGLKQLQRVWLNNTLVSDAGLVHLSGMTQLQCIWLNGSLVTEVGVAELRKALPNCQIEH